MLRFPGSKNERRGAERDLRRSPALQSQQRRLSIGYLIATEPVLTGKDLDELHEEALWRAVASLFLPFLPLLAGQILLNNFLSDIPAVGLADDSVDRELVDRPQRWNMKFIGRFMVEFGLLSSLFDFLTFAALLGLFAAGAELFRTGWFVESLLTELVVALVMRTRRPFFRSRPGTLLLILTVAVAALAFSIPYLPIAGLLGFTALPPNILMMLVAITALYVIATEFLKARFYRHAV